MTDIHTVSMAEIKPRWTLVKRVLLFLELKEDYKTICLENMKNASDICDELLLKFERWEKW